VIVLLLHECVCCLQTLSRAHARGKVVAYRVNVTCHTYSEKLEIPAGNVTTALRLDLPVNSSCMIHLDASTESGFNNSLHPASVVIPARNDGQ